LLGANSWEKLHDEEKGEGNEVLKTGSLVAGHARAVENVNHADALLSTSTRIELVGV